MNRSPTSVSRLRIRSMLLASAARDAAHPPLRGEMRRALQREKIRGFLHLYIGEEAVAVGVHAGARRRKTRSSPPIASTARRWRAAFRPTSIMAEMYGKHEGCCRGRGGSMHLFDAATRFYGGNAIVGGGLPLAVGIALADKMQGRDARDRLLLRRGAVAEGEFHESHEPGRAVEAAGAVRLREQSLRDGHGARARRGARPTCASRRQPTTCRRGRSTAWTSSPSRRGAPRPSSAVRSGERPVLPRVPHLPLPRAFDVRPAALPRQSRGRGVEEARPDRDAVQARLQARRLLA